MPQIWRFAMTITACVALLCIAPEPLYAATCFQHAPADVSVQHLFDAAPLPPLTSDEVTKLRNTMDAMRGKWTGTVNGYWCLGTAQEPGTKPDDYTVNAAIGGGTANQLKLVATMHGAQDGGTHTEKLALFLEGSQFYVDTPAQPDNTHMQARSIAVDHVSFAQMAYPPGSGRVIVRTIDVQDDSISIEVEIYTRDILTSASAWHLTRAR